MIQFDRVTKSYHKELFKNRPLALNDLSFSLFEGQTLGLIGANGAGKSTAIRLIMDFIRPSAGQITIMNRNVLDAVNRCYIGYLPELAAFPRNLSLLDLIRFTANTCGLVKQTGDERGALLLKHLGLWEVRKKRLQTYSKGMQQRASFVLALLNDPQLLILDEPMSGLDPLGRRLIVNLINDLQEQGKTILFCSHILGDIDRLADQLLVLDQGKALYIGSPSHFIAQEAASTVEDAYLSLIFKKSEKNRDT